MSRKYGSIVVVIMVAVVAVLALGGRVTAQDNGALDAAIISSSTFATGTTNTVQISIQNNKVIGSTDPDVGEMGLSHYYGSVTSLSATLTEGNAPIIVETGKMLLGNISSGATTPPIPFTIRVSKDAEPGLYQMVLQLSYRELSNVTKISNQINFEWADKTESKELEIEIEIAEELAVSPTEELDAAILGSSTLATGTTSTVEISVQNNMTVNEEDRLAIQAGLSHYYGSAVALTATLKEANAPLTIETDRVLLGTLPTGVATPGIPFIVKVNKKARSGVYSIDLELTYKKLSDVEIGETVNKLEWVDGIVHKEIRIEIEEEPLEFEIADIEATLRPGVRKEIRLTFKNLGNNTAEAAVAKIDVTDPLSLTDDTAFLGDLEPGDTAVGVFGVKVDADAIPKEYILDAQIKYTDFEGKERLSEKLKKPIEVNRRFSFKLGTINPLLAGGLAGAVIIGVIWGIWFIAARAKL